MPPHESSALHPVAGDPEAVYQVSIDGQATGPYPLSEVIESMHSGRFPPDLWTWKPGWPEWRQLREVFPECVPEANLPSAILTAPVIRPVVSKPQDPGLLSALTYPFAGDGVVILVAGTLFFTVLIGGTMLAPRASLFLGVFSFGYLLVTLQNIVQTSAQGEHRMPSWPAFESATWFAELLQPCLLWIGTLALCLGPGYAMLSFDILAGNATSTGLGFALLAGGAAYLPMALLAVAMTDSFAGLDPRVVIPSILAIPGRYLLALLLLGGTTAVTIAVHQVLERTHLGIFGALPNGFLTLYFAVVQARVLGLIYYTSRDRFSWT